MSQNFKRVKNTHENWKLTLDGAHLSTHM